MRDGAVRAVCGGFSASPPARRVTRCALHRVLPSDGAGVPAAGTGAVTPRPGVPARAVLCPGCAWGVLSGCTDQSTAVPGQPSDQHIRDPGHHLVSTPHRVDTRPWIRAEC